MNAGYTSVVVGIYRDAPIPIVYLAEDYIG